MADTATTQTDTTDTAQTDTTGATDTTATTQTTDTAAAADAGGAQTTDDTGASGAPKPDWRDRRIAQLTARLREAEAAKPKSPAPASPAAAVAPSTTDDPAEFNRRVQAEARNLAAQESFTRACNDTAALGRLAFTDFDTRVAQLTQLVDRDDATSVGQYNNLVAAAIETGAGHQIIHRLGGDLNEASRLLALNPVKLAVELTRMADKVGGADSDAVTRKPPPKPITPVGARGNAAAATIDPTDPERADLLSTAEWMRRREAQMSTKH